MLTNLQHLLTLYTAGVLDGQVSILGSSYACSVLEFIEALGYTYQRSVTNHLHQLTASFSDSTLAGKALSFIELF